MEDDILDLVSSSRSTTEATSIRKSSSKDSLSSSRTEGKKSSASSSSTKKKEKKQTEGGASGSKSSSKKKKKSSSSDPEKSEKSTKKTSSSSASKSAELPKIFKTIPVVAPQDIITDQDFDDVSIITTPRAIRTKDDKKKKKRSKKNRTADLPPRPPPPRDSTALDQEFDIRESIKAGTNSDESSSAHSPKKRLEAVPDDEECDSDRDEEVGIRTATNNKKDSVTNAGLARKPRKSKSTDRRSSDRVPESRQPQSFAKRDAPAAYPASQNSQKDMHRNDVEKADYDEEEARSLMVDGKEQAPPPEQRRQGERESQKAGERELRDLEDPAKECNDEEEERLRKRRIWMFLIHIICCILVIILVVVVLIAGGGKDDDKAAAESPEAEEVFKPDDIFAYESIVVAPGQVVPAMASYDNDCDFNNGDGFPHVFDQCRCENTISYVPEDVAAIRDELIARMFPFFYGDQTYTEPIASCTPTNMALVWLASGNNRAGGVLQQRYALALTFFTLDGSIWDYKDGWLGTDNECYWMGLQVSLRTRKSELHCLFLKLDISPILFLIQCANGDVVNSIAVDTNNVYGKIPSELGRLQGLAAISITRNHLTGTIPTELFSLTNLRDLRLYANRLIGSIPTEVANAESLEVLRVETNFLQGELVSEIGRVVTLTDLNVGFNNFERKIPSELGRLNLLRYLTMTKNSFSGTVPTELGRLDNLQNLTLSENLLSGSIPSSFGLLWGLLDLRLVKTGMSGRLPSELGVLSILQILELAENNFAETLPTDWGKLSSLSKYSVQSFNC